MKKISINTYNVYIIFITLFVILKLIRNTTANYESEGQGGIWNIIPFLIIIYSIILVINNIRKRIRIPVFLKFSVIYALCAMFNSLFYVSEITVRFFYSFIMIGSFSSVLIVFYYLSIVKLTQKQINITLLCSMLIIIATFVSLFIIKTQNDFQYISNLYFSLSLFPLFLYFSNNKIYNAFVIIIVTLTILFATKRVGFIAYSVFLLLYNFILAFQNNNIIKFIKACAVIFVICLVFLFLYSKVLSSYNIDLFLRMAKIVSDGGSGRDKIYDMVWNGYKNSVFEDKILGHGLFSVSKNFGHGHAHNDFLDILYHFGLGPCIFFIMFYLSLIYEGILMFKYKYNKSHIYIGGLVIAILLSMFSIYCVGMEYIIGGMTFLGIALGQFELYKRKYKGEQ